MIMKTRTMGLAAALALTLAACSDSAETDEETTQAEPTNTTAEEFPTEATTTEDPDDTGDAATTAPETTEDPRAAEAPDRSIDLNGYEFEVSLEQALTIAADETGSDEPYQIGMDWSDGAWVWEIDTMSNGQDWELRINATTGDVREVDMESEDDDERPLDLGAVIDHSEAMEIAVREVSGTVTEWELDWDDNRQEYQIEIDDDIDVTINAETGEVIEVDE